MESREKACMDGEKLHHWQLILSDEDFLPYDVPSRTGAGVAA